jgi:hypothetical protein
MVGRAGDKGDRITVVNDRGRRAVFNDYRRGDRRGAIDADSGRLGRINHAYTGIEEGNRNAVANAGRSPGEHVLRYGGRNGNLIHILVFVQPAGSACHDQLARAWSIAGRVVIEDDRVLVSDREVAVRAQRHDQMRPAQDIRVARPIIRAGLEGSRVRD